MKGVLSNKRLDIVKTERIVTSLERRYQVDTFDILISLKISLISLTFSINLKEVKNMK